MYRGHFRSSAYSKEAFAKPRMEASVLYMAMATPADSAPPVVFSHWPKHAVQIGRSLSAPCKAMPTASVKLKEDIWRVESGKSQDG